MTADLSLGELQSLCVKATRGAGRAVGVAEDAGRAVRWLCARGMDGAGALAVLLAATDGFAAADLTPDLPDFTAKRGGLCPLLLGGYLSDCGVVPGHAIGPVHAPELLQPYLAPLGVGLEIDGAIDGAHVRFVAATAPRAATRTRADIDAQTEGILLAFAARTYAPATEASRATGAGAGTTDND